MNQQMTLGQFVKKLRKERGYTKTRVCQIGRINYGTLSNIENDKYEAPNFATIIKLAKVFHVSVEAFVPYVNLNDED